MRNEKGATLLTALVLLTILLLVGVATVDQVSMQTKTSQSAQFSAESYRAALSEIEAQIDDIVPAEGEFDVSSLSASMAIGKEVCSQSESTGCSIQIVTDDFSKAVEIEYTGEGAPPSGYSLGEFRGQRFEISSRASANGLNVTSDQSQGINVAVISND